MGIRLGWLRDHGDLLRTLLRRELRAKYKGSALGVAWSYLYPLLMMAVYTVVFSVLWDSGIPHYPLVVLTGLTAWSFFQSAVYGGATSLVSNAQIIKKVWFPREIVPIAVVLAAGVSSLVMIAVLIPVDLWFAPESRSLAMLLAIPIGLCFFALAAGFAWLLAAANVFFRDVEHFLGVLFLPWFFLTPVFYRLEGAAGRGRPPGADPDPALGQPRHAVRGGPARRAPGRRRARRLRAGLHGGRGAGLPPGRAVGGAALRGSLRGGAVTAAGGHGGVEPGRIRTRDLGRSFELAMTQRRSLKEQVLRRERSDRRLLWALRHVDLDIAPGEAFGVVGQNGSGKSTLLKLLARIFGSSEGTVEVGGRIGSLLEIGAGFHPDFTGAENVYLNAAIHGIPRGYVDEHLPEILDFAELADFADMPVRTYSSGMFMRLGFSVAMHVNPDVLLLDEILAVGDESFQQKCFGRIWDYRRAGGTIVFVSHDATSVERICDRAMLLEHGEVVDQGPPEEVFRTYHRRLTNRTRAAAVARPAHLTAARGDHDP